MSKVAQDAKRIVLTNPNCDLVKLMTKLKHKLNAEQGLPEQTDAEVANQIFEAAKEINRENGFKP